MDWNVSGFQLRCNAQAVFGKTVPSRRALGGLGFFRPIATACCLGSIKVCNGHIGPTQVGLLCE